AHTASLSSDDYPSDLVVSSDGRNIYVSFRAGEILVLTRDPVSGALEQRTGRDGCLVGRDSLGDCTEAPSLGPISALTVSPDGMTLYAGVERRGLSHPAGIVVLRRHSDGSLSQLRFTRLGRAHLHASQVFRALAVSADGRFLYAAAGGHLL